MAVSGDPGKTVLKGVSRSFYLTLRLLPRRMRGGASLGYLLARTSDTLADTATLPVETRLRHLERFREAVAGAAAPPRWPVCLLNALPDRRERALLESSDEIFDWLHSAPAAEAALVREVVEIIVSGQTLDLERFAAASRELPAPLADDAALEDYAWRVAGCVGAFWTKLGFATLGGKFSSAPEEDLLERGIAYGKGLQLVNILRDIPADLAVGRCYLPVADPRDRAELLVCHARWLERALDWVSEGLAYAATLPGRRIRAATALPALLARKTLEPLRGASWADLQRKNKIPRRVVYGALGSALFLRGSA
jgi:farnesyl-diphosphate farnesyltransferase